MKKPLLLLVLLNISFLDIVAADAVAGPEDASFETLTDASKKRKPAEDHQLNRSDDSKNRKCDVTEEEELDSCGICLEVLKDDTITLPRKGQNCGHEYHTKCLQYWLPKSKTCPLCKSAVTIEIPHSITNLLEDFKDQNKIINIGLRKILSLPRKGLTSVDGFEQLPQDIEHLVFANNQISTLPLDFSIHFSHLTYLSFYNNRFTELQSGMFKDAPNLQTLILAFNRLNTIPSKAFLGLKDLKILSFYGNRIRAIEDDAFSVSDDGDKRIPLQKLNFSNNRMRCINTKSFTGLTDLERLSFRKNFMNTHMRNNIHKSAPEACEIEY